MTMIASDVQVYTVGLCSASCCAPADLTREQVANAVNMQHPTGISSRWEVSEDTAFATGQPHPCVCEQDSTRRYYLLNC